MDWNRQELIHFSCLQPIAFQAWPSHIASHQVDSWIAVQASSSFASLHSLSFFCPLFQLEVDMWPPYLLYFSTLILDLMTKWGSFVLHQCGVFKFVSEHLRLKIFAWAVTLCARLGSFYWTFSIQFMLHLIDFVNFKYKYYKKSDSEIF